MGGSDQPKLRSEMTCQKLRELWKDPDFRQRQIKSRTGHLVSEETKQKIRDKALGRVHTEETKQKCRAASLGRVASEEFRQKMREIRLSRMAEGLGPYRDTKPEPEREVESHLQEAGLSYEKQVRVGMMLVDFYLPQQNLVIEVDGCWWHGCLDCYPGGGAKLDQFEERQKQLSILGYSAIRIWEHELLDTKAVNQRLQIFIGESE